MNPPRLPRFWRISCSRSHCSLGLRAMTVVVKWDQRRPGLLSALVTASLNADVEVPLGAHRRRILPAESACHRLRFGGSRRLHLQSAGLFSLRTTRTSFTSTRGTGLELAESQGLLRDLTRSVIDCKNPRCDHLSTSTHCRLLRYQLWLPEKSLLELCFLQRWLQKEAGGVCSWGISRIVRE